MHQNENVICLTAAVLALVAGGCAKAKKPIVVGSKSTTAQALLGEIVAQHLEHRLGRKIERRLNLGGTLITYQTLVTGEITVYPEYTGAAAEEILREQPSPDPSQLFGRVKGEMLRIAQAAVMDPLGIDNGFVLVVRDEDATKDKLRTISDAIQVKDGWKLGVSFEFEQRNDGMAALNQDKLPMSAPVRSMDLAPLFKALGWATTDHDRGRRHGRSHHGARLEDSAGRQKGLSSLSGVPHGAAGLPGSRTGVGPGARGGFPVSSAMR